MAFASMFIATIFVLIVLAGLVLLLIGIILDIIWGVRKHKEKKVYVVHKVFAIILTVAGVFVGLGPIAGVGIVSLASKMKEQAEISDLADNDLIYVKDMDDVYSGFDFNGVHYVSVDQMKPQMAHDNFVKDKIGAIVFDNGSHRLLYGIRNSLGITILTVEQTNKVFVDESDIDRMIDYYDKEAPLYSESASSDTTGYHYTENIDSARIRSIRDLIVEKGNRFNDDQYRDLEQRGYILFYSTDDMSCFSFDYYQTDEGLFVGVGSLGLIVEPDDADYIMSLLGK